MHPALEENEDRRSGPNDRREIPQWLTPPFLLQLIVQFVAVVAIIVSTRADAANSREKIAELRGQVTSLQSLVQVTTEQKGDITALKDRMTKAENAIDTQIKAYNYDFTTRLARIEAKNGILTKEK